MNYVIHFNSVISMKNRLFEITLRTFIYPDLLFENKIDSVNDLYKLEFS